MELDKIYSSLDFINKTEGDGDFSKVNSIPNKCPHCHITIKPIHILGIENRFRNFDYIFQCSNHQCERLFIAYYKHVIVSFNDWELKSIAPIMYKNETIKNEITEICPMFEDIYNEAREAELRGLLKISGMGYRKALEFLIKDYLINYKGKEKAKIEGKFLGRCLNEDIENYNIKEVAKRAAWLGNDETHYIREWEDKNIDDLKLLLELTINWIVDEIKTAKYISEMTTSRK